MTPRNNRRRSRKAKKESKVLGVGTKSPPMGFCMGEQILYSRPTRLRRHRHGEGVQQWDFRGFGYDTVREKYKVVFIFHDSSNSQITTTKVFMFGITSWTTHQTSNVFGYSMIAWDVAFVGSNSNLNWLAVDSMLNFPVGTNHRRYVIVNFNLSTYRTGNIWLPNHAFERSARTLEIGVMKGYLSVFQFVEQNILTGLVL
ncbi:F-box associated interaction domain [Sesbania bispinosa]|nr:F-box associated interaction domain [Sesbania bispinosa]